MLGYVRPVKPELRIRDFEDYKAVYCGLCNSLGKFFGPLAKATLSYDFTFLAMLMMSARKASPQMGFCRCPYKLWARTPSCGRNEDIRFAAACAVLVIYYKLCDDILDSPFYKRFFLRIARLCFYPVRRKAARQLPEINREIAAEMKRQHEIETEKCGRVDLACDPSAKALGVIFKAAVGKADEKAQSTWQRLGFLVGRYVYMCDALDDLKKDRKSGGYNVFLTDNHSEDEAAGDIHLTISEIILCYEALEINYFKPILDNIVYLGLKNTLDVMIRQRGLKA